MKLENQVYSLKLAKRLKKLGVKQESLWYWVSSRWGKTGNKRHLLHQGIPGYAQGRMAKKHNFLEIYSAFTVAELGEILARIDRIEFFYHIRGGVIEGFKTHDFEKKENKQFQIIDKSEANARAKMLIYLIENKLVK